MGTTLTQLQTGKLNYRAVLCIEGWSTIYTDGDPAQALTAHTRDWTEAKGGLSFEGTTSQKLNVWNAFTNAGEMTFYIQETNLDDPLGVAVARSDAGAETFLRSPKLPGGSVVDVASTVNFPAAPGAFHIGTEAYTYSGKSATQFTGVTSGLYAPFGTKTSSRFEHTHRIAGLGDGPQIEPVVSEQHRSWIGRWVGLWVHRVVDGGIDNRDQAQLLFAGRIAAVLDDPNTGNTVIKATHLMDFLPDEVILKDQFTAVPQSGIYLWEGIVFRFRDWKAAVSKTANELEVVSGASGPNQIEEGYYELSDLASLLNTWLEAETIATRLHGNYSISTPAETDQGFRSMFNWRINGLTSQAARFRFSSNTAYVLWFLGFYEFTGTAESEFLSDNRNCGEDFREFSAFAPFTTIVSQNVFSSGISGDNSFLVNFETTNGAFVGQSAYLPEEAAAYAASINPAGVWGLFLVDDVVCVAQQVDADTFKNVKALPGLSGRGRPWGNADAPNYGRRAGDNTPLEFKQIFILESTFAQIFLSLLLSTGTTDYNDDGNGYDVLGYGLGIGIPYELVTDNFTAEVIRLAEANDPMRVVIEKPTSLKDLLNVDLILRHAYLVWKNGRISMTTWSSPTEETATHILTESNKAKSPKDRENQNTVSNLTDEFMRNVVKITASREFRTGSYVDTYTIQDRVSMDDNGGMGKVVTLPARNLTSATVWALIQSFVAFIALLTKPLRVIRRSVAPSLFEGVAPGDIAIVSDDNARDPTTGRRGINGRPGLVISHTANWGGDLPSNRAATEVSLVPPVGEVDVMFVNTARVSPWAPAVMLDDTADAGGFTSGYNNGTMTVRTLPHKYSGVLEAVDASRFIIGDKVEITEVDPAVPSAVLVWYRTITNVSGNDITLDAVLTSPAFDANKFYLVRPQNYLDVQATQRSRAFLADDSDGMVLDARMPYQFGHNYPIGIGTIVNHTYLPERYSELSHLEGEPLDFGHEHGAVYMANNLLEHKLALNTPCLSHAVMGPNSGAGFLMVMCRRLFIGRYAKPDSGTINATPHGRKLELHVWGHSKSGASSTFRATLSRYAPVEVPGNTKHVDMTRVAPYLENVQVITTMTFGTMATFEFDISPFNLVNGTAYLLLEVAGEAESYGFDTLRLKERF